MAHQKAGGVAKEGEEVKHSICTRDDQCLAESHFSDCRVPTVTPLSQLLRQVDDLFAGAKPQVNETYNYSLGRFPSGWSFTIANSWHRWLQRGLECEFRLFGSPEEAVEAFLVYVAANDIDAGDLME